MPAEQEELIDETSSLGEKPQAESGDVAATSSFSAPIVSRSCKGQCWTLRTANDRIVQALAQEFDLEDPVARILCARGFNKETAPAFLIPRLRDQMPDPLTLRDMDKAVNRTADAVIRGQKITIFGDYDVDGATSSSVLNLYLRAAGHEAATYIPDRLDEGYGPNVPAMQKLAKEGTSLCITVDCGTTAFEPLQAARDAGMDVIVLDHHVAELDLPPAVAIVNPNRLDETSLYGNLAAVGVTFLFCVALNRELRDRDYFSPAANRPEPNLMNLLDLVALGTVADVVALTGLNRVFVAQGLEVMAHRGNVGLSALMEVAKLDGKPLAWHCGFMLGPRVNAGGRVGQSDLGTRLLTTDDHTEAHRLARELDALNTERRDIESRMIEQAIPIATKQVDDGHKVLLVAQEDWHPGVIGIVASRLKEQFGLPAVVIGSYKGKFSGSGRSVKGVDLGAAVISAKTTGLLTKGGGHKMAAGLSILPEQIPAFHAFLDERIAAEMARTGADKPAIVECDALLSIGGASARFIHQMDQMAPFGTGNPEPRVILKNLRVAFSKAVGANGEHVSCQFISADGKRLKAIAFRAASQPHGLALLDGAKDGLFHVCGTLSIDGWNGKETPSLQIYDVAPAFPTEDTPKP